MKRSAVEEVLAISRDLGRRVERLRFRAPVAHVYNPLRYARRPHETYLARYARPGSRAVLVGMNPGPWGMVQTGVPFGEVTMVRDWLGIEDTVEKPKSMHPRRPIEGFSCSRSEVSGKRLWGWARKRFREPDRFFRTFFIWNYCPLAFLEESGKNRTPDKLQQAEVKELFLACDQGLQKLVSTLQPEMVIGIGKFAEKQVRRNFADATLRLGGLLHPSPASPAANQGWEEKAELQLRKLGVL